MKTEVTREEKTFFVMHCDTTRVTDGALVTKRQGLGRFSWDGKERYFTSDPLAGERFASVDDAKQASGMWFSSLERPKYEAGDEKTLQIVKVTEISEKRVEPA